MTTETGVTSQVRPQDMRGKVIRWDGAHGIIETDSGVRVSFFPVHLIANGYEGRVSVGDRVYFKCNVVETRSYCLDTIKAVALA
jgi:hypothetical protein